MFQFWGTWRLVWGDRPPKAPPVATGLIQMIKLS